MFRLIVLLSLSGLAWAQSIDEIVIPKKTELFITLERSISSKTAAAGDKFYGRVAVPITQNDRIVIPTGSYVIGHVDAAREAGRLRGKGSLGLRLDTIILPDGVTREIQAVLTSAEGYENTPPNEKGQVQASGGQGGVVAKDATTGASVGAVTGAAAGRSWSDVGLGAGLGAATGAIIGALKKNDEVNLPRGTSITVVLDSDVRFVKPAAKAAAPPL
jgi:hypothetical protein